MLNLYDIQPESCRLPLPYKEIELHGWNPMFLRVLRHDPFPQFQRIIYLADPYQRVQVSHKTFGMIDLFPAMQNGYCDCGCGKRLEGKQRRWATADCSKFVYYVYAILIGRHDEIARCLELYYGRACQHCGVLNEEVEKDHIVPVHKGGGSCWLSNYQFLCKPCHKEKTYKDIHFKEDNQLGIWQGEQSGK